MSTSLRVRLRAAAAANPGLSALLGTTPFRWYDNQLVQGSAFPAVVVRVVSNPSSNTLYGRLPTSSARVQFTVWGDGADSSNAEAVAAALIDFISTFNGDGITGRIASPNQVVNQFDAVFAETQPPRFQQVIDIMIFNNDSL